MKSHPGDDLILRHLDGETTEAEARQVTRLLADDPAFRSRFFSYASQVARLRTVLSESDTTTIDAQPAATPTPTQEKSMNLDLRRIYFNAVLGGSGGLLGWALMFLLDALVPFGDIGQVLGTFLRDAVVGPVLGICIGFAIGSVDGLIAARSLRRVWLGGGYGIALGALGGLIGLPLGEFIYYYVLGPGVWPRAIGWAVFGMFVGTSDGFAQKIPSKIRYGVLGGLLGGLVGGSTFQTLLTLGGRSLLGLSLGGAVGLIILGACIGALVGLVESLLRKAWLFFLTGRLEGQTRTLDSSCPHTLGSADTCTIVLPGDAAVRPVHAEIRFENGDFVIRPRDGKVRHNDREAPVSEQVLAPGDRIQVGETKMTFRNEDRKYKVPVKKLRPLEVGR
jgi:hypothetical protein